MVSVCFFVTGFGNSEELGGAAIHTVMVAKGLAQTGLDVSFLTTRSGMKAISRYYPNFNYFLISSSSSIDSKFNRLLMYFITLLNLRLVLNKLPYFNCIITNDDYFCETIPAFYYKLRYPMTKWLAYSHEPPVIIWFKRFLQARTLGHSLPLRDALIHLFYYPFQLLSFLLFKLKCDVIISIGSEGYLVKKILNLPDHKFRQSENGIDTTRTIDLGSKKFYDACFLGGNRNSKGIYDLIPIWAGVIANKPDAKLLVIGFSPSSQFKELIIKNNLQNNIVLYGYCFDRDILFKLLLSTKLFIFPSHKEGWAIPITEAMMCGLPVIVWNYPFYYDIYNKGIIYVNLGAFDAFANVIYKLLGNKAVYDKYSNDAIQMVSQYSWSNVIEKELDIIKDVVWD